MLKRIFLAGLVAPGVFGASGLILTKVVRLGDPGNSREVGIALWQLESFVDGIIAEEGARPKDERVNRAIESAFQSEQQEEPLDPPLSRLVGEILKDPRLGSLGSPPVFRAIQGGARPLVPCPRLYQRPTSPELNRGNSGHLE